MKKLLLAAFVALLCTQSFRAQNLKTDSIFNWGKTGWELPADMVSDQDGNFYVTGSFSGDMNIGNLLVKSNGQRDIFLAKFSPENQLIWAKNLGGTGDDNAYSLLCSGNKIYLAGSFRKEIAFNNGTIKLLGKGLTDVFLAQLTADGNLIWANSLLSDAPAQKAFLAKDSIGNIFIAGSCSNPVESSGNVISTGDQKGFYYASFNTIGKLEKHGFYSGSGETGLNDFAISPQGNLCFAGYFENNLTMKTKSIKAEGKTDGFVALIDPDGNPIWLNNAGGVYDDEIKSMAHDKTGNIYVIGDFKYSIKLDKEYSASQNTDAFIAKYNKAGQLVWSRQLGADAESYNTATQIEMADGERFFVTGAFRGKLQNSPEVKSEGNSKNAFLARYSADGKRDWILGTTSKNENKLWMRLNKKTNGLFISGYFSEDFKLGEFELKNKNYKDIFFGNLVDCDLMPMANLGPDTNICSGTLIKPKTEFASYLWNNGQTTQSIPVSTEGIYSIQAKDKYGCLSIDSLSIKLKSAPVIDLGQDAAICHGQDKIIESPKGFVSYLWENGKTETQRVLNQTGKYRLTVTDSLGCSATDSIFITVNELPEFILGSDDLQLKDTITLEPLLVEGDYLYEWSTGSNSPQLKIPARRLAEPTDIKLTITDKNLCCYTNNLLVRPQADANNGFGDGENSGYRIYPNPGNGHFYIQPLGKSVIKQVDVFDPRGLLVKSIKKIVNNPVEVNLSGNAKGAYLIVISEDKVAKEFKVVLE